MSEDKMEAGLATAGRIALRAMAEMPAVGFTEVASQAAAPWAGRQRRGESVAPLAVVGASASRHGESSRRSIKECSPNLM